MGFAWKAVGQRDESRLIGAANVPTILNFLGFYATDVTRKIKRAAPATATTDFSERGVLKRALQIYLTPVLSEGV